MTAKTDSLDKQVLLQDLRFLRQVSSAAEQDFIARMSAFVKRVDDPFSRSTLEGHITASAWILNKQRSHVLLCHHRKLDMWVQLGGHMEPEHDDSVFDGALREAYEESGLVKIEALSSDIFDVDIHPIPAHGDEPEHFHYDVRYLFASQGDDSVQLTQESKELAWVKLDEVQSVSSEESLLRMAKKTVAFLRS